MGTEIYTINEKSESGKRVQLTPEFEKHAIAQGLLDKQSVQYVKSVIEKYWNSYIDTGGKTDFIRKSIESAINREIGRAKDDLKKGSLVLPKNESIVPIGVVNNTMMNPPSGTPESMKGGINGAQDALRKRGEQIKKALGEA